MYTVYRTLAKQALLRNIGPSLTLGSISSSSNNYAPICGHPGTRITIKWMWSWSGWEREREWKCERDREEHTCTYMYTLPTCTCTIMQVITNYWWHTCVHVDTSCMQFITCQCVYMYMWEREGGREIVKLQRQRRTCKCTCTTNSLVY